MIIDDEELVIRVVRRFLASDGYEKFRNVDGSGKAIETIEAEKPDVVLLDIMMPHVTGLDLLKVRQETASFSTFPLLS